jgi:hypothetical protein
LKDTFFKRKGAKIFARFPKYFSVNSSLKNAAKGPTSQLAESDQIFHNIIAKIESHFYCVLLQKFEI